MVPGRPAGAERIPQTPAEHLLDRGDGGARGMDSSLEADAVQRGVRIEAATARFRNRSQQIQVGRRVNPLKRLPGCRRSLAHGQPGARHRSLHRGVALRALGVPGAGIVRDEQVVHVTDRPVGL